MFNKSPLKLQNFLNKYRNIIYSSSNKRKPQRKRGTQNQNNGTKSTQNRTS